MPMGTSGSRMRPDTQIRASDSKLRTGVVSMAGRRQGLDLPKENKKSKDDVVFPRMKVSDYDWRGCVGT